MLLNQLRAKFGALPADVEQQLQQRSPEQLDQLTVALIHAESLEKLGLG